MLCCRGYVWKCKLPLTTVLDIHSKVRDGLYKITGKRSRFNLTNVTWDNKQGWDAWTSCTVKCSHHKRAVFWMLVLSSSYLLYYNTLCYENLLCGRLDKAFVAKYMLVLCAGGAASRLQRVLSSSSWTSSHQWCWRPLTCSTPRWPGSGETSEKLSLTVAAVTQFLATHDDFRFSIVGLVDAAQPHPAYSYPAYSGSAGFERKLTSAFAMIRELSSKLYMPCVGICGYFDHPVGES